MEKRLNRIFHGSQKTRIPDRIRIRKALKTLRQNQSDLDTDTLENRILRLESQLETAQKRFTDHIHLLPTPSFDERLPIVARKEEILAAIQHHQVVVIAGETGSGKTTQLPKICLEAGLGRSGMIGCTQPRRIAAVSVAERIAEELQVLPGESVGYKVRFRDKTRPHTAIKLMTDGILLAESLSDPYLNQYDTLIVDEAHERSLNIDFLLGFLIRLVKRRKDLKVLITSATIDTEKFSKAFGNAPVIEVSGRMYPVEVRYEPPSGDEEEGPGLAEQAATAVDSLVAEDPFGDILVFMPTEQDIRETCDLLEGRRYKSAVLLPLYARLTSAEQRRVFQPAAGRKIVVATNVAETSLTIPGIRYVVDTGVARIPRYIPGMRTTTLPILPISRSSADQRKGRCGRVENGICIRLYSEEAYETRERFTLPEILRANLADVLLKMTALKLGDIRDFPFVDRPADRLVKDGYDILQELGAICPGRPEKQSARFRLTEIGRQMAKIPLDPRIARMLIAAKDLGCVKEVAVIAAGITAVDPRERPDGKIQQAEQAQKPFVDPLSDFVTLLTIWNKFTEATDGSYSTTKLKKFVSRYYLSFKRMREWRDLYFQILEILEEAGIATNTKPLADTPVDKTTAFSPRYEAIHKAILAGYLSNIARKKEKNFFTAAKNRQAMLFPGSGLFNKAPEWVVAAEMVETSRLFARCVAAIEPEWIASVAGDLMKETLYDPHWEKKQGAVIAFRQKSLYGLIVTDKERTQFGPLDPEEASRIFIRSALVDDDVAESLPFLTHNRNTIRNIQEKEDRLRRRDLFAGEDALIDFYTERLSGIYDIRTLKRRIREAGSDGFLRLTEKDILLKEPDAAHLRRFPEQISLAGDRFPCSYAFHPGKPADGITVTIPSAKADVVGDGGMEWLVPGLLPEKIEALLRGLPKSERRRLVPLSDAAALIAKELKPDGRPLATAISRLLYRRFHLDIPASRFAEAPVPDHLRMRVRITDAKGKELRCSRDLKALREGIPLPVDTDRAMERLKQKWEKPLVSQWDFGDLPREIPVDPKRPQAAMAFPGLSVAEGTIRLHLFQTRDAAQRNHVKGVAALLKQHLKKDIQHLERLVQLSGEARAAAAYFGGAGPLEERFRDAVLAPLLEQDIRSQKAFAAAARNATGKMGSAARDLMHVTAPVLSTYKEMRMLIDGLSRKSGPHTRAFMEGIGREMARLVPENFATLYQPERIQHLPRYLEALGLRAKRAADDLEKDARKAQDVMRHEENLKALLADLAPGVSDEKKMAVESFFWMLEEFKVSVFAQELGTDGPISAKRLKQQLSAIRRMV